MRRRQNGQAEDLYLVLGAAPGYDTRWNLDFAARRLEEAGFQLVEVRERICRESRLEVRGHFFYLEARKP
ncbi:MAG TPA: hypothetical protein VKX16_01340 [Chloroflexota bacterium]|nr:hypothetical protein [Chloroflexota bacterium]